MLGSVGEPINAEAWKWYHDVVGDARCSIVDTWWQTETGGIMLTPLPGDADAKPGAATRPFFGVEPVLLDAATGAEIEGNDVAGVLALKSATPGMARTIANDYTRFIETYWKPYPGYYFTGDGARRDADGHYHITGRVDDVINVSGHRVGTAEIESVLTRTGDEASSPDDDDAAADSALVVEAAVVGYPHDLKGEGIYAFVILKGGGAQQASAEQLALITQTVRNQIGPFAAPDVVQVVQALPKTRSGKIMRRVLRKIAKVRRSDAEQGVVTWAGKSDLLQSDGAREKATRTRRSDRLDVGSVSSTSSSAVLVLSFPQLMHRHHHSHAPTWSLAGTTARRRHKGDTDDFGDLSTLADPQVVDAILRNASNMRPDVSF